MGIQMPMKTPSIKSLSSVFCLGVKKKKAAEVVLEKQPKTIFEAQDQMRVTISNHKALFGSRSSAQRQVHVSFAQGSDPSDPAVCQASKPGTAKGGPSETEWHKMQEDLKKLQESVAALLNQQKGQQTPTSRSSPPSSPRRDSGSPRNTDCFYCKEPGHFKRDCPKLEGRRSPVYSPRTHLND